MVYNHFMNTTPEAQFGNECAIPLSAVQWKRIGTQLTEAATPDWTSWWQLMEGRPGRTARGDITPDGLVRFLNNTFPDIEARLGGTDQIEVRRREVFAASDDPAVSRLLAGFMNEVRGVQRPRIACIKSDPATDTRTEDQRRQDLEDLQGRIDRGEI